MIYLFMFLLFPVWIISDIVKKSNESIHPLTRRVLLFAAIIPGLKNTIS